MLIENNTLYRIDRDDLKFGVFISPDDVFYVGDDLECDLVRKMILPNVKEIGNNFLAYNTILEVLEVPKVENIGNKFLFWNKKISVIDMPNIKSIEYSFLFANDIFKYTPRIIKALKVPLIIGGNEVDKKVYLRKLNIKKILCL